MAGGDGSVTGAANGRSLEKLKFTVSVRGHQWSSARHLDETLEELVAAFERNARRLAFIDDDASIQRLQLAYSDGSEPEDLDVDATLGDVIICMGDKQLLAIVNSTKPTPPPSVPSNGTFPPRIPPESPSLPFHLVNEACSFHPDYVASAGVGANLPPSPRPNGKLHLGGFGKTTSGPSEVQQQLCNPTPSVAELTSMLMGSSSQRMPEPGVPCNPDVPGVSEVTGVSASTHALPPAPPSPTAEFLSFASALQSQFSMLPNQTIQCPHGATTNIALLAQFMASQLHAFSTTGAALPSTGTCHDQKAPKATNSFSNPAANPTAKAIPACNLQADMENRADPGMHENYLGSHYHHPDAANHAKQSVSGMSSPENSKEKFSSSSYSSANLHNSLAPASGDGGVVDSEMPNGSSELVFLVNRRSKMRLQGVGTHHLKMSDLSAYYHLSVVNAAKKLGVSQTTLKKACRKFGLKRWPGRKVRSLESTIHGLEHTIAVSQTAGLEESNEAYMRSEVCKLQQEMDQLVHGTPAQVAQKMHSPTVRTADLYKRLYSCGWRSRFHSAGLQDVITLDTKRASGLAPPTTRKYCRKAPKENIQQQRRGLRKAVAPPKEAPVVTQPQPTPNSGKDQRRDAVMKDCDIEGLLPDVRHDIHLRGKEARQTALRQTALRFKENGNSNGPGPSGSAPKATSVVKEEDMVVVKEEEVVDAEETMVPAERCLKRPKIEMGASDC